MVVQSAYHVMLYLATFIGINNFISNLVNGYHKCGGAIHTSCNGVLSFTGTDYFTGNSANYHGSAICAVHNISLTFAETTGFNQNSANAGGNAIYAEMDSSLPFIGTSTFSKNTAKLDGGASLQTSTGH